MTDRFPQQQRPAGPLPEADEQVRGWPDGDSGAYSDPEGVGFTAVDAEVDAAMTGARGRGGPARDAAVYDQDPGAPDGQFGRGVDQGGPPYGEAHRWAREARVTHGAAEAQGGSAREWFSRIPRRWRWASAAAAVVTGVVVGIAATEGSAPPPPLTAAQAAKTPDFDVAGAAHLSKAELSTADTYMGRIHDIIATYEPFMLRAAEDPRAGNANKVPDHGAEVIAYMYALLNPYPVEEDTPGPVVWSNYDQLVAKVNKDAKDKGIKLPALQVDPPTPEEAVVTNLTVSLSEIGDQYVAWAKDNKGKSVADFAAYFFRSGNDKKQRAEEKQRAELEYEEWHSPTNDVLQGDVVTNRTFDEGYVGKAYANLKWVGLLRASGKSSQ